jgi:poly-gamma-glutamate capsule biosynthesis protein CapA/YwtB (metallophosphatase superfamily)
MAPFTLVAAGDCIITRRLSHQDDPSFTDLVAIVRQGHAAFANLELTTPRRPWVPGSESGGMWLRCDPFILDELRWMGFNLFNVATNHATDFTVQGLVDTMEELRARNMVFAGGGMTLGEARSPGYLETRGGRVALLAAASTFGVGAHAADPRPDVGGRPGISPLRFHREYVLDPRRMAALRDIDEALGTAEWNRRRSRYGVKEDDNPEAVRFLEASFVEGEAPGIRTRCSRRDLEEIVRWIGDARRGADYVLMSIHAHEGAGPTGNSPSVADFLVEAAHACVDAGADAVIGHGSHQLRPVEVYQGRPILYSLGNFMYMSQTATAVGGEMYERLGLPPTATPQDVHDARSRTPAGEPIGFQADPVYWESVVPVCRFEDGHLVEMRLHPVELGRDRPRPDRGSPRLAAPEHGRAILSRLAELCQPYGTRIEVGQHGPYAVGTLRW